MWKPFDIFGRCTPLEQFDQLHCDNQRYWYKVCHHEPPRRNQQPKSSFLDIIHNSIITRLKQGIEQRHNQRNKQLPYKNRNNHFIYFNHHLRFFGFKVHTINPDLSVRSDIDGHTDSFSTILQLTASQYHIINRNRNLFSFNIHEPIDFVEEFIWGFHLNFISFVIELSVVNIVQFVSGEWGFSRF